MLCWPIRVVLCVSMLCCAVLLYAVLCCSLPLLQGPGFNEQVASLQSEVRLLKKANQQLTEDHKVRWVHYLTPPPFHTGCHRPLIGSRRAQSS